MSQHSARSRRSLSALSLACLPALAAAFVFVHSTPPPRLPSAGPSVSSAASPPAGAVTAPGGHRGGAGVGEAAPLPATIDGISAAGLETATCETSTPAGPVAPPTAGPGPHPTRLHIPILLYHRIVPPSLAGRSLLGLVVSPDVFAAQMTALADAGWHTLTAGDVADDLAREVEPPAKSFVVTFDDGYADGYTYAFPILRSHGFVATYFINPGRIANGGSFLTASEVQQLSAAGNEIGNHTMSHVDLRLQSPAGLRYQIDGASTLIARMTGRWPESFAYPFGARNPAVVDAVGSCGSLGIALTTASGASEAWASRFETPRLSVGPSTTPAALLAMLDPWR